MDLNHLKMKEFICSLIEPKTTMNVLDIGCGRGEDLFRISQLTSDESSRFVGLDTMEGSIDKAKENYGHDSRMSFITHDVSLGIPCEDNSCDLVISTNMLECVTDKQKLLKEVHRVLKPDGQVIFAHFDWDSQLIDGENKPLVRSITQTFSDWKQDWMTDIDSWMGRRLWRTFQESGRFSGRIETCVLTNTRFEEPYYGHMMIHDFKSLVARDMISAQEFEEFMTDIESLNDKDQFFYSITMYIYVGSKKIIEGAMSNG